MKPFIYPILMLLNIPSFSQSEFRETQQSYSRVRTAYLEKWEPLKERLSEIDIDTNHFELYIQAFKQEGTFEVWIRDRSSEKFVLFLSYEICAASGQSGPKRAQGDMQVPEGFYSIDVFNPWSNFYLSLGINYPNPSDRILGERGRLGGDIYIHGSCVTIGCIPLTDHFIKEFYILCVEARSQGQKEIPVTLYPARMNPDKLRILTEEFSGDSDRLNLWSDLKIAYEIFQLDQQIPVVEFLEDGRHHIHKE